MSSSPIRSRSRSPVTPPADRDGKVPPEDEDDDRVRNDRDDRDERDYRDDRRDDRDDKRAPAEDDDNLDFDWKKVLITALEDNSFTETSLAQETWDSLEGATQEVACNVVKRVSESNLRNVRNLDGFARSILRRIEQEGIDVGRADLSSLDRDVADAINRHVDDRAVEDSDFSTVQVVNALKEMPVRDAIEAIDQFAKSNLDHVRNRTGFFMSIIRRVKEEARGFSGGGRGGGRGGGGYGGGRSDDRYSRGDRGGGGDRFGGGGDRYGGGGGGDRFGGGGDRFGGGGGGGRDYRDRGGYNDRGGGGDRYERGGGGRDRYGDRDYYAYDRSDRGDRYGDRGGRYDRGRY